MAWAEKRGSHSWRVRYWKDDGTLGSVSGFETKTIAENYADDLESDKRKGTWIDPAAGKLSLHEWSTDWLDALEVSANTEAQYRSLLTNHILPRWGTTSLSEITGIKVAAWSKTLRAAGYSDTTVGHILKVLSLLLSDAADDRLIPANPMRGRRRRTGNRPKQRERPWITHEQALLLADHTAALVGNWAAVLVTTAAWTGARWGELTGLQRANTHLDDGYLVIDPDIGALHEVNGRLELGPPKTPESARTITLLRAHLNTHQHPHVFVTAHNNLLRRSNFARRAMHPATHGTLNQPRSPARLPPLQPGFTFHGLRHSHKTWMIGDAIPDIAQAHRLGHTLRNKIEAIYSHVPPETQHTLLDALQDRWNKALANAPTTHLDTTWRDTT